MPSYTWMFDKNGQPTEDAIALVAYLQKLGTNIKWREEGVEQVKKLRALNTPPEGALEEIEPSVEKVEEVQ